MNPKVMLFLAIFAATTGQVLMKLGMTQLGALNDIDLSVLVRMIFHPFVFAGIVSYGLGFIAYLLALSKLPQSFAYPMFALGYILVAIFNWTVMRESFIATNLVGVICILVGVWLLNVGR